MKCFAQNTNQIIHSSHASYPSISALSEKRRFMVLSFKKKKHISDISSYRTQIWINSVVPLSLEIWVRRKRERVLFSDTLWVPWHTGDTCWCIRDIKKCILHDRSPLNEILKVWHVFSIFFRKYSITYTMVSNVYCRLSVLIILFLTVSITYIQF